ncbi:hypothetical protein [Piscinibacter terrae]|uniref:Transferrin-binding protein B C-lobe/N-lobe beta barrel domain-containing protein n=1 Tax=Piscinibacter terrae TaxID=2496871 RepID=A0A3N7HIX6_9BURK|nr:hypothetical protein [Albitalea terrae]RQP21997.1 hypothetical protein DZC73_23545 [Albitalea terrae]
MSRIFSLVPVILLSGLLASCGGGGSDAGFTPTAAAGLYEVSGGSGPAQEVQVLDSGRFYVIYGMNSTTPVPAAGVMVADASTSGLTLSAGSLHDFNFGTHAVTAGTASGSYVAKTSIAGTASLTGGATTSFGGSYNTNYDQSASLSSLAGNYAGEAAELSGTNVAAITINSAGLIAGTSNGGCTYAGLASPHSSGNVFDITLNFQTNCAENGNTLRGHAFVSRNVLYLVVVNGDTSRAVLFAGLKS